MRAGALACAIRFESLQSVWGLTGESVWLLLLLDWLLIDVKRVRVLALLVDDGVTLAA